MILKKKYIRNENKNQHCNYNINFYYFNGNTNSVMNQNKTPVQLDQKTIKQQMATSQTIQKISSLLEIAEGLNGECWDGVQKLNLIITIENKLFDLIDEL
tara:strand:- start:433 stop:732 length:300 start_codon:yes stop_codon:yes gene_type:complete